MEKMMGRNSQVLEYPKNIETLMRDLYQTLSEKDRRHYAAIEALKLPYGGKSYICLIFGCDMKTLLKGIEEIEQLPSLQSPRIRSVGGGRKKTESLTGLDRVFLDIVRDYTAGDPMREDFLWINLSFQKIAKKFRVHGFAVSKRIVKQLMKKHHFGVRKACKIISTGKSKDRNEQFENIAQFRKNYRTCGNPVISIDTKKKEFLGLFRSGTTYTTRRIDVFDHDFPSLATGVFIPYGIYDIGLNDGYISIGKSHDTSEFAIDSIIDWWMHIGKKQYPNATSLLILADGGGSNSSRSYLFKEDLQRLSNQIGIEVRIAHYPPYTSKWNPIEHRLFSAITRSLSGVILKSYEFGKHLIEETTTESGLKVMAKIVDTVYKTGKKCTNGFKEAMNIIFDDYLPRWNYRAIPQ